MSAGRRARGGVTSRRGREENIGVEAWREDGVVVAMVRRCTRAGASLELRSRVALIFQNNDAVFEANAPFTNETLDARRQLCPPSVPRSASHSRYSCTASATPLIHAAAAVAPGSATLRNTLSGT